MVRIWGGSEFFYGGAKRRPYKDHPVGVTVIIVGALLARALGLSVD